MNEETKEKTLFQKLTEIQFLLKAPKNQYNSFGKFYYRNCEDILEAVKPLLHKEGVTLTISDTIERIGERYYVKATATIFDKTEGCSISNTAYAREDERKSGMDTSQLTGSTSSYARRYALNGLFLIDDTKATDTDEFKQYEIKCKQEEDNKKQRKNQLLTKNANRINEEAKKLKEEASKLNSLDELRIKILPIVESIEKELGIDRIDILRDILNKRLREIKADEEDK